ncbi:MAG: ABC transporter permease [Methanolinea sp.]|nr:ABC transporter permease [Methanolinea sp.]
MSYLVFVAAFGCGVAFFLWIRDARIFVRTGLPGYRNAAYRGVLHCALALLGFFLAYTSDPAHPTELIGLGIILAALYLQGRVERERVFSPSGSAWDRLTGKAPRGDRGRPGTG